MEEEEIWKDIEGYEGLYQVSNMGRVRSLDRYVKHNCGGLKLCKGKIMKLNATWDGYLRVDLCKNGKHTHKRVNRLVAEAFIPNPDNLPQVGHKDECKTNNCVSNLYWTTEKENNNHGKHNERVSEAQINGKRSKPVLQYTLYMEFVREWPSAIEINRQLGYSFGNICNCCRGLYKQAYGFIWCFACDVDKEKGVA